MTSHKAPHHSLNVRLLAPATRRVSDHSRPLQLLRVIGTYPSRRRPPLPPFLPPPCGLARRM